MSVDGAGLFITTDAVGGVWSYSLALARGVAAAGIRCVLAVLGPPAQAAQRSAVEEITGCSLLDTGLPLDWTVNSRNELDMVVSALIEQARQAGCGTAHLHAPALAALPWPMPTVAVAHSCMATWWDAVHGGVAPSSIAWHRAATAEGLARADEVVAPSRAFADALVRVYQPARAVRVIHNGLPTAQADERQRDTAVLAAGRLWDPGKNLHVLDSAAAMLDVPVFAAGPTQAPDGSLARFTHLRETGTLTQAALRRSMAGVAIFAAPSLYEPFGLAVLEAAQIGTPLLLSDIPTFRELWSDAAVFVRADEPAAWAEAIGRLIRDPDQLVALGEACLRRSRCYTQHAMVSATVEIHRGVGQHVLCAA